MALLIGIDEAGYGPLLGPLVVAATVWRVPPNRVDADMWSALDTVVARAGQGGGARLEVDDSKTVYNRKQISSLERPVLAFASAIDYPTNNLGDLLGQLTEQNADLGPAPWYRELSGALPLDPHRSAFAGVGGRLRDAMSAAGVELVALLAEVVSETRFNDRVAATRNKAAVLVEQVLRLMARGSRHGREQDVHICVDRLGGREDYRHTLQSAFPERHVEILEVSEQRSRYRLGASRNDWWIEFLVDGDLTRMPIALASMVAKYAREALMERFNAYWKRLLPSVRPTAGYYVDAQRFLADIREHIGACGLPESRFVRAR